MQVCFFEDDAYQRFHPLTLTRPVDDLRTGILTISEKWEKALEPDQAARLVRPSLTGVFNSGSTDPNRSCYWINSRYVPDSGLIREIQRLDSGSCLMENDTVVAAHVDGRASAEWLESGRVDFNTLFVIQSSGFTCLRHVWDLFTLNGEQIAADLELLGLSAGIDGDGVSDHAFFENPEEIYLGEGAVIEAGCVLNADGGPIHIGKGATVMAGSVLRGPVAVCENAVIKAGAKIYPDTTIGPVCKVGGEVNNCIFHSYSNKGHDGFVGNSLFGQWCNLGADTNTSNLKNNYSDVRITDWESQEEVETGQQFLGTVMGDHSKTAINTQLNTGTVCGVSCNIFASDFPPKFIPSFSWVGSNVMQPYHLNRAFDTMEAMMARRDVELSEPYKTMMRGIFEGEHGKRK